MRGIGPAVLLLGALQGAALFGAARVAGQSQSGDLPFGPGESLIYQVTIGRFGKAGRGELRVDGPVDVRGRSTYRLGFDFSSRVALFKVEDETHSWLDPEAMASLRYHKRESHPLSKKNQLVEVLPEEGRWQAMGGEAGELRTAQPLDELSFIYFVRTLPLSAGAVYTFERHYQHGKNPVTVRVLGRERLAVPAGEFRTVVVEMRVQDPERYGGQGVIKLYLSDDAERYPVRIETALPVVGSLKLSLAVPPVALAAARGCAGRAVRKVTMKVGNAVTRVGRATTPALRQSPTKNPPSPDRCGRSRLLA